MYPFQYSLLLFFCISIHALPKSPLKPRYPDNVPQLPFPSGGNDQSCPTAYTNLFNQGVQKRSFLQPSEEEIERLRARSLESRQFNACVKIAHFDWTGFSRPLGNTQDLWLTGGSTYTFVIGCSTSIKLAYAWTAPFASDHYTLIGTGGNGGQTASITLELKEDSHVHFEALSDYTMSNGAAAVYKQDR